MLGVEKKAGINIQRSTFNVQFWWLHVPAPSAAKKGLRIAERNEVSISIYPAIPLSGTGQKKRFHGETVAEADWMRQGERHSGAL